jgi:16S rRNA (cytosine1402-N4)-methyltransferase
LHQPVLLQEVLRFWAPPPAPPTPQAPLPPLLHPLLYVDGTLGMGGHSEGLLQCLHRCGAPWQWLGADQDPQALALAQTRLAPLLLPPHQGTYLHANYSQLLQQLGPQAITGGLLLDLGVSSFQLDTPERGFSFSHAGPLDMRMNPQSTAPTAAELLNTMDEATLADWFYTWGEEKLSRPIAKAIVQRRQQAPWQHTAELAALVEAQYKRKGAGRTKEGSREKKHPATRVFQALRVVVNDEFGHLEALLGSLPQLLAPQAKVLFLTFHSLEDRCVKRWFTQAIKGCTCPAWFPTCQCGEVGTFKALVSKPFVATEAELAENPRARSAKLRVYERL